MLHDQPGQGTCSPFSVTILFLPPGSSLSPVLGAFCAGGLWSCVLLGVGVEGWVLLGTDASWKWASGGICGFEGATAWH